MKDAKGHGSNARGGGSVFDRHQTNIAKKTLKMSPMGAKIMGGMDHDQARAHLASMGWSPDRIAQFENSDQLAQRALSSGTSKSDAAPVHDSMAASIDRGHAMRTAGDGGHVPGFKMDSQTAKRVSDAEGSMSRLAATFKQGDNRHGEYGRNVREAFDRHAEVHAKLTGGKKRSIYD